MIISLAPLEPRVSPMFVSERVPSRDAEAIPALSWPLCCRAYRPR